MIASLRLASRRAFTSHAASACALAAALGATACSDDSADVRPPGSPHWQAVQDLCADRLAEYGYQVVLDDYGTGINVIGRRLGKSAPEQTVVVAAHYDHIDECAGADDNASGVAATLEIVVRRASASSATSIVKSTERVVEDGAEGTATSAVAGGFIWDSCPLHA